MLAPEFCSEGGPKGRRLDRRTFSVFPRCCNRVNGTQPPSRMIYRCATQGVTTASCHRKDTKLRRARIAKRPAAVVGLPARSPQAAHHSTARQQARVAGQRDASRRSRWMCASQATTRAAARRLHSSAARAVDGSRPRAMAREHHGVFTRAGGIEAEHGGHPPLSRARRPSARPTFGGRKYRNSDGVANQLWSNLCRWARTARSLGISRDDPGSPAPIGRDVWEPRTPGVLARNRSRREHFMFFISRACQRRDAVAAGKGKGEHTLSDNQTGCPQAQAEGRRQTDGRGRSRAPPALPASMPRSTENGDLKKRPIWPHTTSRSRPPRRPSWCCPPPSRHAERGP